MRPGFDTNVRIDYRNGNPEAAQDAVLYPAAAISRIPWNDVMAGAAGHSREAQVRSFVGRFKQIPIDRQVAEVALLLRRYHCIGLSIIVNGETRSALMAI